MAASTDFNYANLLSLDKAKLFKRSRLNFLGTKELILDYQLQTSGIKEEAMEWLEENSLTLTNPKFGHKTYTGVWNCIEILFNEDKNSIRQRFQIDSSLTNDVSSRSNGGLSFKSYYWRIVDPQDYNIPAYDTTQTAGVPMLNGFFWYDSHTDRNGKNVYHASDDLHQLWYDGSNYIINAIADGVVKTNSASSATIEGSYTGIGTAPWIATDITIGFTNTDEWNKTVNDNGDGTYDVVISRNSSPDDGQSGYGAVMYGADTNTQSPSANIVITGAAHDVDANGTYTRWQYYSTHTADAVDLNALEWYDINSLVNGEFVSYDTNDTYAHWFDGSNWLITVVADVDSSPTNYFTNDTALGAFSGAGGWVAENDVTVRYAKTDGGSLYYPYWKKGSYEIKYVASISPSWTAAVTPAWVIYDEVPTAQYLSPNYLSGNRCATTASVANNGWMIQSTSDAIEGTFVIRIGQTGPAFNESSSISINSAEKKFVTDGGTIADPVAGEIKSIQNVPLVNGKFKTTITTKTALQQRLPPLYDMLNYNGKDSDDDYRSGILVGKGMSLEKLLSDMDVLSNTSGNVFATPARSSNSNSVSVSINQYGKYDYTLTSQFRT